MLDIGVAKRVKKLSMFSEIEKEKINLNRGNLFTRGCVWPSG